MNEVGQAERVTQNRVVELFKSKLGYRYLGDWQYRENSNIEKEILNAFLQKQNYPEKWIKKAIEKFEKAASLGGGKKLYQANEKIYGLLRYGVKVKTGSGENAETLWFIDWKNIENNDFAIAEEVTIRGPHDKRPDIVLYVNGIALGVIELKRSRNSIGEGIRQNLDNQKKGFIRHFFTTMQLVMAGNDSQGLRYGTIETPEKHFYEWKEAGKKIQGNILDFALENLCEKKRFLEIIHNFIVFDKGIKKICRHNQYFGVKSAEDYLRRQEGGIIWHTQGSGKSLTMVWLAKWIRENLEDARVVVVTDRRELDKQIEGVFLGVSEKIHKAKSSADLVAMLNTSSPWLLCSLVHKFGGKEENDERSTKAFIKELHASLPKGFKAKGDIFVFVDECHRTQSGKLHAAMKEIMPNAVFIGFTGTPLLKNDKLKSIEVFGSYIHTYKYTEAVRDGVVLDLRYEARNIEQRISSPKKIDEWFEAITRGLTDTAKARLKQRWGTMKKLLSSKSRLKDIVVDIQSDFMTRPRLMDGRGNALLVCASIYQACKVYELFSETKLKGKCAIVTSYQPSAVDIKGEESGEGATERLKKYDVYRKMIADFFECSEDEAINRVDEFENKVKERFQKEPGKMQLLIVVDKLLTGFDAPSATYLYIDKQMQDHGLFQAICRVNRLDGEDKEYGYIIDYKDLFHSLENTIHDYTSGAFDHYDKADVLGLLGNRFERGLEKLEEAREAIKALCEPVMEPRKSMDYFRYFCGPSSDPEAVKQNEAKRLSLYKYVSALVRAYSEVATRLHEKYSEEEFLVIKGEVEHFAQVKEEVRLNSGDYVDLKKHEPGMRNLLDNFVRSEESNVISNFENLGLVELLVSKGSDTLIDSLPDGIKTNSEAVAETIENNVRKVIVDNAFSNPKFYEKMSDLLDALIEERRRDAWDYKKYLEEIKNLAEKVKDGGSIEDYPDTIKTRSLRALYDNLHCEYKEALALEIDATIRTTKRADWVGNRMKEREILRAIHHVVEGYNIDEKLILEIAKHQSEYRV